MAKKKKIKLKTIKEYDILKKIRHTWDMNPVTRVKDSKKTYKRKKNWEYDKDILGI